MSCYHPIKCWQLLDYPSKGETKIYFGSPYSLPNEKKVGIALPCGKCVGCREDRAKMWAVRCAHESRMHDDNCFITLTYRDEDLPVGGSLDKSHFVLFMKRFRKKISPLQIRFFHCAEYGENYGRPHHHAIIFGYQFPDRVLLSEKKGVRLYTSQILSSLWRYGYSSVGDVTYDSCRYVAKYVVKKLTLDEFLDTPGDLVKEYITMSRNPGIGSKWYEKYKGDIFPCDNVVVEGKMSKVPRFYNSKLELEDAALYNKLRNARIERAKLDSDANSRARLKAAEDCKRAKLKLSKRGYESGY